MLVAPAVKYKAVWERTTRRLIGENKFKTVLARADTADSPEFENFKDQDRGYLTITDMDGNLVHGLSTTVITAKSTMKACASGKYDPFPAVKKKDRAKEVR